MANKLTGQDLEKSNSNAKDFIKYAEQRGAEVSGGGIHTKVKVPGKGTVIIDQTSEFDPQTRRNLMKWFKLLGLLVTLGAGLAYYLLTHFYITVTQGIVLHIGG